MKTITKNVSKEIFDLSKEIWLYVIVLGILGLLYHFSTDRYTDIDEIRVSNMIMWVDLVIQFALSLLIIVFVFFIIVRLWLTIKRHRQLSKELSKD
ncbi:MAG: hypothetical protein OXU51_00310 [Candidatus Poribacteria bacterium]|nr:hypothetical protein [Candidatus Poribacteria bacterium]